jgi:hypothetical protein
VEYDVDVTDCPLYDVRIGSVTFDDFGAGIVPEMLHVASEPRAEIIQHSDSSTLGAECVDKVGTDESGSPCDKTERIT